MGRYIGLPHSSQTQRRPIDRPARTKRVKETGWEGMDWTNLAQNMDNWQAVANMVMNIRVS